MLLVVSPSGSLTPVSVATVERVQFLESAVQSCPEQLATAPLNPDNVAVILDKRERPPLRQICREPHPLPGPASVCFPEER